MCFTNFKLKLILSYTYIILILIISILLQSYLLFYFPISVGNTIILMQDTYL